MEGVGFCQVLLGLLVRLINRTFRCDIDVRPARSLKADANTMLHASARIAAVASRVMLVGTAHSRGTYPAAPPLAQARPRSQKTRQNSGSTPTPCLDKTVPACGTHDGKHT